MVSDRIKAMVEEVTGGQPVEIGKAYVHPTDGPIEITSGQYWGTRGLSNFWYWRNLETGEEGHGYGGTWPQICGSTINRQDGSRCVCIEDPDHPKEGRRHRSVHSCTWGTFREHKEE